MVKTEQLTFRCGTSMVKASMMAIDDSMVQMTSFIGFSNWFILIFAGQTNYLIEETSCILYREYNV